jgi:hypothetical protein
MDATPVETQEVLNDGLRILARIIARDIMIKRAVINPIETSKDNNREHPQEK